MKAGEQRERRRPRGGGPCPAPPRRSCPSAPRPGHREPGGRSGWQRSARLGESEHGAALLGREWAGTARPDTARIQPAIPAEDMEVSVKRGVCRMRACGCKEGAQRVSRGSVIAECKRRRCAGRGVQGNMCVQRLYAQRGLWGTCRKVHAASVARLGCTACV